MAGGVTSVVVITHVDHADTLWIEWWAAEHGAATAIVRPYAGEPLPELTGVDGVVVLGGPVSAYDDIGYLVDEIDYLREAIAAGVRVIGICLGAQLLTVALGGRVFRGLQGPECGVIEIGCHVPGLEPLLGGRFFSFHGDVMIPPEGAVLLAISDRYSQAWSLGSALALQFHPELSPDGALRLFEIEAEAVRDRGVDVELCLEEITALGPQARRRMFDIATWWLAPSTVDPLVEASTPSCSSIT